MEERKDEHAWPLKTKLSEGYQFFTKSDLLEFLSQVDDETPIWLNNYWQPVRQITQRPMELLAVRPDGVHIAQQLSISSTRASTPCGHTRCGYSTNRHYRHVTVVLDGNVLVPSVVPVLTEAVARGFS